MSDFRNRKLRSNIKEPPKKKLNIYDAFNPVICVSTFGGVSTIWKNRKTDVLHFRPFLAILTSVILIITVLHMLLIPSAIIYVEKVTDTQSRIPTEYRNKTHIAMNSPQVITKLMNPLSVSLTAIAVRIVALVQMHNNIPAILDIIKNVDTSLDVKERVIKNNATIIKISIVILILVSWPFQVYSVCTSNSIVSIVLFSINLYDNFSTTCCDLQYSVFCYIVYTRFKMLHRRLKQIESLLREKIQETNLPKIFLLDKAEPAIPKKRLDESQKIADVIGTLKKCHMDLCEASQHLNTTYNIHLLVTITTSSLNVLLNVYYAIYGGFRNVKATHTAGGIMSALLWGAYYLQRFVCICTVTDYLTKEANSTKLVISTMMNRRLDQSVKDEIWTFLGYGLSKEVSFTACGFFRIDFKLITSAIATGTTYLVILAQFHKGC